MDLRTVLDRISPCVTREEVAAEVGVPLAQLEGTGADPAEWQPVVARLVRDRARELSAIADEIDPPSMDPAWESAYG